MQTTDPAAPEAAAACCGAKITNTFADAAIEIQLLTLVLFAVALAAVVLWIRGARTLSRGGQAPRSLGFLAAWRAGGPLLALSGIAYLAMNFMVAIYAYPGPQDFKVYAPGFAEMAMVLWAGLLAGAFATLAHGGLKARLAAH
ncbi:hypothetical protein LRS10_15400 [Phenylobacterium sp. J426]|uniref:hypothetical protein n=1 Tax=Phenylobacterium sp. J426 TaxID=2898439 RepID=UPI002151877C|nr:hypothetical protein [Phenylobacterium sp. J426]MCR5875447.1 hypothetical protein [Phenylobacterium sp. J426]